ncbi:hypothetical protein SCHPADRAFT_897104 [Schizopora paradoxa]|uniref:Uncharacterized protein n=1 Tax=Schizopora paradoxa TaxID=27342 RepID=A0A0H2QZD5_9AGAM|nr:hypothetical protein SCHPADRAFT_897104 [Schizopora paradoxa]
MSKFSLDRDGFSLEVFWSTSKTGYRHERHASSPHIIPTILARPLTTDRYIDYSSPPSTSQTCNRSTPTSHVRAARRHSRRLRLPSVDTSYPDANARKQTRVGARGRTRQLERIAGASGEGDVERKKRCRPWPLETSQHHGDDDDEAAGNGRALCGAWKNGIGREGGEWKVAARQHRIIETMILTTLFTKSQEHRGQSEDNGSKIDARGSDTS